MQCSAVRSFALTVAAGVMMGSALVARAAAQGRWGIPFDHETIGGGPTEPNPNATDHLLPFGGYDNPEVDYFNFLGTDFDWRQRFNAVHMALIPKGPHQGKVVVWGATVDSLIGAPVLLRAPGHGPPLQPDQYWACAAWSIVDPAVEPAGPRFRNFLLPIDVFTPPSRPPVRASSLFCAGQAWSPHGDLVVAGGTGFGAPSFSGAKLTYAWNAKLPTRGWPDAPAVPLYPGEVGLWEPGPPLAFDRFYPTTTLTARLQRLAEPGQPAREVVVVAGGSVDDLSTNPRVNVTWNNYEALVVEHAAELGACGLSTDRAAGVTVWSGPGKMANPPPVAEEWLEDYPRLHLLTTGELFFSGYAPRWAMVDHDAAPGVWRKQSAPPWSSTDWQFPRHDGTSLLFPGVGGMANLVVRLGGSDESNYVGESNGTTATIEVFLSQGAGGFWAGLPNLPNPQPGVLPDGRYLMNVVILPDASVLVLGGSARLPGKNPNVPILQPLLLRDGSWTVLPANPIASPRDYHSTAVLLPDGRVLLGGGNGRFFDYEVYLPQYLAEPKPAGVRFRPALRFDQDYDAFALTYGATAGIACDELRPGESIAKVVLLAPGATTHHSDMSQRYLELPVTRQVRSNHVEFDAPTNDKHAPRGIYMLFVLTSRGAVADALWVVFR